MGYLNEFCRKLEKRWKGSLVSIAEARKVEPNAKKYLSELAKQGQVERVAWGWYWVPGNYNGVLDFLAKEWHFKVLQKQTAAAVWSGDFIHRDVYRVAVQDPAYARALEKFARLRGWKVVVEVREFERGQYRKAGRLPVEALEETVVDCLKEWAFADAFASLYQNRDRVDWGKVSRRFWERISHSNARVGQVLSYGSSVISKETGMAFPLAGRAELRDPFVRRQVEEAAEQVVALA